MRLAAACRIRSRGRSRARGVRRFAAVIIGVRPRERGPCDKRTEARATDGDVFHRDPAHGVLAAFALTFGGGGMPGASFASGRANAMRLAALALADTNVSAATAPSSCQFESSSTWRKRARSFK